MTYTEIKSLPIDTLTVCDHHPRMDLGDIDELADSIKTNGLAEPIAVFQKDDGIYGIIDGVRRFEAAKQLGWTEITCINTDIKESEAAHNSFLRNSTRNNLNAIEIAEHLKTMNEVSGYSYQELSKLGYGSKGSISNYINLLERPEEVQALIRSGKISATHGYTLAKVKDRDDQIRMAQEIVDHSISVARLESRVNRHNKAIKVEEEMPIVSDLPEGAVPGVYFKDSRHMEELDDNSVDLIVTSPPYFAGKEYEEGVTFEEHIENIQAVMKECARVLKDGCVLAVNCPDIWYYKDEPTSKSRIKLIGHLIDQALEDEGMYLDSKIIWKKHNPWRVRPNITFHEKTVHTNFRILDNYEEIYIFKKVGKRELPSMPTQLHSCLTKEEWTEWITGIWTIFPKNGQNLEGHPAVYPEELCSRLIRMFSFEGEVVVDPFTGSGTTVKVARDLGRVGLGYERELKYKPIIMQKLGLASEDDLGMETMPDEQLSVNSALWTRQGIFETESPFNLIVDAPPSYLVDAALSWSASPTVH